MQHRNRTPSNGTCSSGTIGLSAVFLFALLLPAVVSARPGLSPRQEREKQRNLAAVSEAQSCYSRGEYSSAASLLEPLERQVVGEDRALVQFILALCYCGQGRWERSFHWFTLALRLTTSPELKKQMARERSRCIRKLNSQLPAEAPALSEDVGVLPGVRVAAAAIDRVPNATQADLNTGGLAWAMPGHLSRIQGGEGRLLLEGTPREVELALEEEAVVVDSKHHRIVSFLALTPDSALALAEKLDGLREAMETLFGWNPDWKRTTIVLAGKEQANFIQTILGGRLEGGGSFQVGMADSLVLFVAPEIRMPRRTDIRGLHRNTQDSDPAMAGPTVEAYRVPLLLVGAVRRCSVLPHWFLAGNAALLMNENSPLSGDAVPHQPQKLLAYLRANGVQYTSLQAIASLLAWEFEGSERSLKIERKVGKYGRRFAGAHFPMPKVINRTLAFLVVAYLHDQGKLGVAWEALAMKRAVDLPGLLGNGYCGLLGYLEDRLGDSLDSSAWRDCPKTLDDEESK